MFTNLLNNSGGPSMLLKSEKLTYNESGKFALSGTPNTDAAILFVVNGLIYFDEADVTYDAETKTFTWANDKVHLSETDRIMALYSEDARFSRNT